MTTTATAACPAWCEEKPHHDYELFDSHGRDLRHHTVTFGERSGTHVLVSAEGTRAFDEEVVGAPRVCLSINGDLTEDLPGSAVDVHELASALLATGEWLEAHQ